ncbi:MAG: hypothetical protein WKF69_13540 [Daejeonella sp.]
MAVNGDSVVWLKRYTLPLIAAEASSLLQVKEPNPAAASVAVEGTA